MINYLLANQEKDLFINIAIKLGYYKILSCKEIL